jgi:hypothetical protein
MYFNLDAIVFANFGHYYMLYFCGCASYNKKIVDSNLFALSLYIQALICPKIKLLKVIKKTFSYSPLLLLSAKLA